MLEVTIDRRNKNTTFFCDGERVEFSALMERAAASPSPLCRIQMKEDGHSLLRCIYVYRDPQSFKDRIEKCLKGVF